MAPSRRNRSLLFALYLNAALMAGVIVALLARPSGSSLLPVARGEDLNIAGGGGVYLMPGQISPNVWGVYMMDIDSQTLMVYQYTPLDNQLKLKAARSYRYDRKLTDFNVGPPTPGEVKELVERQQQRARGSSNTAPSPDNK